jgi:hypothetical protein
MGRTENGGGDQLARGGVKATFRQPNVSKKKYQEATSGFDLERFLKGETKVEGKKETTRRG